MLWMAELFGLYCWAEKKKERQKKSHTAFTRDMLMAGRSRAFLLTLLVVKIPNCCACLQWQYEWLRSVQKKRNTPLANTPLAVYWHPVNRVGRFLCVCVNWDCVAKACYFVSLGGTLQGPVRICFCFYIRVRAHVRPPLPPRHTQTHAQTWLTHI